MPKTRLFLITWLLWSLSLSAQIDLDIQRTTPEVLRADGSAYRMPWAGGLNAPQASSADLDGDGASDDLYLFDRGGNQHLAFVLNEAGQYEYAPELTAFFPPQIKHWVLLRDFDGDGNMDLFAHSDTLVSGILVYQGVRRADGRLEFERLNWGDPLPILYFPLPNGFRTQIFISTIDYPAIDDLDCDGDLDILTFSSGGGYVEWYKNLSVERGFGRDTLIFELEEDCYGGIYESGLSPEVDLPSSANDCALREPITGETPAEARHAGSTLLTFDADQDGIKELALGDVSFTEIVVLENSGSCDDAYYTAQELNYPSADVPVDLVFFPAAFHLDIDQDGVRDFVAAPNQFSNSEDYSVLWYYRNVGMDNELVPVFQDSQFLVRDMIDLGTGAIPTPFDANNDGRMDLVVANYNRFGGFLGASLSKLVLFENISSTGEPIFRLADEDYLGMLEFNNTTFEFAPTFGDLNGDGKDDALIGGQDGKLFFRPNSTTGSGASSFGAAVYPYMDIDVGQAARPRIIDLDRDGLNDLVIGGRDGRIRYFRNIGTVTEPAFNPDPTAGDNLLQLGGIDARNINSSLGYAAPFILDSGDDFLVFTGTNRGQIELYSNVSGNLNGVFDREAEFFGDLRPGLRSEICLADFSGDGKYDLVVGNNRGGLEYFSTGIDVFVEPNASRDFAQNTVQFQVFPNPASGQFSVTGLPAENGVVSLYDLAGRKLQSQSYFGSNHLNFTRQLPAGVYVLRYLGESGSGSRRVVIR